MEMTKELIDEALIETLTGLEILVADDNVVNRMVAVGQLSRIGLEADEAEDGNEILERLEKKNYDVILMDCYMPDRDGFSATREIRLRESGQKNRLTIIAMTASTKPEEIEKCYDSGMDHFLAKPLTKDNLQDVLRKAVNLRQYKTVRSSAID